MECPRPSASGCACVQPWMSEWELSTAAASISNSDTHVVKAHVHAISVRFTSCSAMLTIRFYLSARQMLQWSNLKLKDRDVSHNSAVCPTLLLQNKNCTKLWGVWGYARILPEFDYWTWIFIPLGIYSLLRLRTQYQELDLNEIQPRMSPPKMIMYCRAPSEQRKMEHFILYGNKGQISSVVTCQWTAIEQVQICT